MNWDDGRLFLAIARAGQMLAAAKLLGINQATLSRRMVSFEKSLGVSLLIRKTNGCQLTDEGLELMRSLELVETQYLHAQSALKPESTETFGTLRIGTPDGFGVSFLAPQIHSLTNLHPRLKVQLVPVHRTFSLSRREADIAVAVGRPSTGRLVTQKLTDYSLSLYASKAYCDEHGVPENVDTLSEHKLISYVEDLLFSPDLDYADKFATNWKPSIEISTATGQMEAVKAGAGVGILHDYLASEIDNLVLVLPQLRLTRSYWMVHHEDLRGIARINAGTAFLNDIVSRNRASFVRPLANDATTN